MSSPDSILNLPSGPRMLDAVRQGLSEATDVRIAVSFTLCSGLGLIIDNLKEVVQRQGTVRILTSTYQWVTQPDALRALAAVEGVEARVQHGPVGFHSKFWWFTKKGKADCWIGSSNLSRGGLSTNVEWNVRRHDLEFIASTAQQFDELWHRPDVYTLDDAVIDQYRKQYLSLDQQGTAWTPFQIDSPNTVTVLAPKPNVAQTEALRALALVRQTGARRAAIVAATGIGKTYLAAFDAQATNAKTLLFVSHRLEHLLQAMLTFKAVFPNARMGIIGGGQNASDAEFLFVTIASLNNRPDIARRRFDYLVIDEFHHAEAPSYGVLRDIRNHAFLLGLTATPERQDGHDVLAWCDWNIAYEVRLPEAIEKGWLLPFHYYGLSDDTIEYKNFPWRSLAAIEDLLSIETRARQVFNHAIERGHDGKKRRTVGFCAGRRHAEFMAASFNSFGETACAVLGDMSVEQRRKIYEKLSDPLDSLNWIFVSDILNEGVDIPSINSVLFLRPTESPTLFLQQLGRGLRLFPDSEVLTVIDFVGHHRSAWLSINALDAPNGTGRLVEIQPGSCIRPPSGCELVLQRRTLEILQKVKRFSSKREACSASYVRLRNELQRPLLPVDLWNRSDVPDLKDFHSSFFSWIKCQAFHNDEPEWSKRLSDRNHLAFEFLRIVGMDWQAQRIHPYALVWGLCHSPDNPGSGYSAFFERFPQWKSEFANLASTGAWKAVEGKLKESLSHRTLHPTIVETLGDSLLVEVEGRLLYTANNDFQTRHGGVLRSPAELILFGRYSRPEIIRHFGEHYDPTKHNKGIIWFGQNAAIIMKLDNSGAKATFQYPNEIIDHHTVSWTTQNRMNTTNRAGRDVLDHVSLCRTLFVFVQRRSHEPARFLGTATVSEHESGKRMRVRLRLEKNIPVDILSELTRQ